MSEPVYDQGIIVPERRGYCSCYCGELHNHDTYKIFAGSVYWLRHGKYPNTGSHVGAWLESRTQEVLL